MLAEQLHNAHYKEKRSITDFMPHYNEPEVSGSISDVMRILSGRS